MISSAKCPLIRLKSYLLFLFLGQPDAKIRDMVLAIRADEAHHREVNHSLSDLKPDESNPFPPGK